MNASELLCGAFELSAKDVLVYELAKRYHAECEAYDRIVCTGPIREGSIMPFGHHEFMLVNRNAIATRKRIMVEAMHSGITREEMARAISRYDGHR